MVTPLASPVRKAVASVKGYLEDVGHITRLADPHDAWLPITASQSGNSYYAAFHSLSSGIGFQALVLPAAFASLGWYIPSYSTHRASYLASTVVVLFDRALWAYKHEHT
jgi:hypothetical protein